MRIDAPIEWVQFANEELMKAKRKAAKKIYARFGNEVMFPMFLHIDLCTALHTIYESAPTSQEAEKFIHQAMNEAKSYWEEKNEQTEA